MKPTVKAILARCGGDSIAAYNYCMGIYHAHHREEFSIEYWLLAGLFAGDPDYQLHSKS